MHLSDGVGNAASNTEVTFEFVAASLGGRYAFWHCPSCQRRCGVLYLVRAAWRCHVCAGITHTSSNQSDKRISRLLASRNLAAELEALRVGTTIGALVLSAKAHDRITRQAQREFRRWWRQKHPRRHMPRRYRRRHAVGADDDEQQTESKGHARVLTRSVALGNRPANRRPKVRDAVQQQRQ
jgi:hypothetical protein